MDGENNRLPEQVSKSTELVDTAVSVRSFNFYTVHRTTVCWGTGFNFTLLHCGIFPLMQVVSATYCHRHIAFDPLSSPSLTCPPIFKSFIECLLLNESRPTTELLGQICLVLEGQTFETGRGGGGRVV